MSSDGHLVACLTTCIQLLCWSSYTKVAVSCMQWDTCAMGHLFANISHNVWILDFDAFVLPQRICIAQRMRSCSCSWWWNLRSREDLRVESMSEHCRYLVCATSSLLEGVLEFAACVRIAAEQALENDVYVAKTLEHKFQIGAALYRNAQQNNRHVSFK